MQKKKNIKPLIAQLQTHDFPSQIELETLKLWFLDFLGSIEGITDLNCVFSQASYPKYVFEFKYSSVPFRAVSVPPSRITINTLGLSYYLDSGADQAKNVLVLASAIASELKILRVDFN